MGKTVAIIVGVVAGVAVLIVFLSFCRKALGNILIYLIYFSIYSLVFKPKPVVLVQNPQ